MNQYPYMDPGQTSAGSWNASQSWGEQPASPAGDWMQRGPQAWVDTSNALNNYLTRNDPRPQWNQSQPWQQNVTADTGWLSRHGADMIPGTGAVGGFTKVVRSPSGANMVRAFADDTGQLVGSLGFRHLPGKPGILQDIKVDPAFRGQGYADQMLDAFRNEAGGNMRFGGTITNSVPFWERLADKWAAYPDFTQGLRNALEWRY